MPTSPFLHRLLFLFLLVPLMADAQDAYKDSLQRVVDQHSGDTNEVNATYMLARYTKWSDTETALKLAGAALQLAHQLDYTNGKIWSYNTMGVVLQDMGEFQSALLYLDTGLQLANTTHDSVAIANFQNNKGLIYLEQGNYELSLSNLLEAATIREKIGDKRGEAGSNNNIGLMYSYMGQHEKAIEYYSKSLTLKQQLGDEQGVANTYLNIGLSYDGLKDTVQERYNYRKALEIYLRLGDKKGLSMVYNNFGEIFTDEKDYAKALAYHDAAYKLRVEQEDIIGQAQSGTNIAACLIQLGRDAEAETYLRTSIAIAEKEDNKRELVLAYRVLSDLYVFRKQYDLALEAFKKSAALNDSVLNEESAMHLQEMEAKYASEKKEKEILQLQADAERDAYRQNLLYIIGGACLLVLAIVGYFLFARYKAKQQQLKELAVLETKQHERMRIARDMHDDIGAGLTRISLLSEQVKSALNTNETATANLARLTNESRLLTGNLGEIIWTMSPKNDTLEGLTSYLRNYAYDYLEQAGIDCVVKFPDEIPNRAVSAEFRRNIFLVVKEALNNIVKYAQCTEVILSMELAQNRMTLSIQDNGKGLSEQTNALGGNGFVNMRKRAQECGGTCSIESKPGGGVMVKILDVVLAESHV